MFLIYVDVSLCEKKNESFKQTMQAKLLSPEQQAVLIRFDNSIQAYKSVFSELMAAVKATGELLEGNIWYDHHTWTPYEDKTKSHNLFSLASESTNMLEIGFNAGHSCLVALLANPHLKITAVDIGKHKYVQPCYAVLQRHFGEMIHLITGSSESVLPALQKQEPAPLFDLIHIDGSHNSRVANTDMFNSIQMAAPLAYVILDDTQKPHLRDLWKFYTDAANLLVPKLNIFPHPVQYATMHSIGVVNAERIVLLEDVYKEQVGKLNELDELEKKKQKKQKKKKKMHGYSI